MAKGEGAESGSAAGLLPTGVLQAGERPAQVMMVRARHPGWRARGGGRLMAESTGKRGSRTPQATRGQGAPGAGESPEVPRRPGVMEKVCGRRRLLLPAFAAAPGRHLRGAEPPGR